MKRYFSAMTAQQAPSPRAARQALESFPGVAQTASQMPHCTSPYSALTSSASSRSVITLDEIDSGDTQRRRAEHPKLPLADRYPWQHQAAIGQKHAVERIPGGARAGKSLHQHVPE